MIISKILMKRKYLKFKILLCLLPFTYSLVADFLNLVSLLLSYSVITSNNRISVVFFHKCPNNMKIKKKPVSRGGSILLVG